MNSIPHPDEKPHLVLKPPTVIKRQPRKVNYGAKLASNEAAIERWMTKQKLAFNKLNKLFAKHKRLQAAQTKQAEQLKTTHTTGTFSRKFL